MATLAATDPTTTLRVVRSAVVDQARTGHWGTYQHMAGSLHSRRSSTWPADLRRCGLVPVPGTRRPWTGTRADLTTTAVDSGPPTPQTTTLVDLQPVPQGRSTELHRIPRPLDELLHPSHGPPVAPDPTIGISASLYITTTSR